MLRDPTDSYAQRMLVSVMGDYEHLSPVAIPSSVIVRIMSEFDISEDSTRNALSQITRRGYLVRYTEGRRTSYRMSKLGSALIADGRSRVAEFGSYPNWNGLWTLVVFSVPEKNRDARHQLRVQLRELGFAPFYNGTWIAAHADPAATSAQLTQVENADVAVFESKLENPVEPLIVKLHSTWKLDSVRQSYQQFLDAFTPHSRPAEAGLIAPAEAFALRTRLLDAWRVFPRVDPDLPAALLPDGWPRTEANRLFLTMYDALQHNAEERFRTLLSQK